LGKGRGPGEGGGPAQEAGAMIISSSDEDLRSEDLRSDEDLRICILYPVSKPLN